MLKIKKQKNKSQAHHAAAGKNSDTANRVSQWRKVFIKGEETHTRHTGRHYLQNRRRLQSPKPSLSLRVGAFNSL